ncbi:MAG: hypothetical protein ACXW1D_00385 [Halobacteriota archaeon]
MSNEAQKFAHIYKAPAHTGFKWQIRITDNCDLSKGELLVHEFRNSKAELKSIAKNLCATPWNY